MTPIFSGRVKDNGVLRLDDYAAFRAHMERLSGKPIELTVKEKRAKRSLEQNAYWWAVPVELMSDYMGEERTAAHYALLGECFGYHWNEKLSRHVPNKGSSSALTTDEFSRLIEWCPPWALEHHGVHIPLPNEVEVSP